MLESENLWYFFTFSLVLFTFEKWQKIKSLLVFVEKVNSTKNIRRFYTLKSMNIPGTENGVF